MNILEAIGKVKNTKIYMRRKKNRQKKYYSHGEKDKDKDEDENKDLYIEGSFSIHVIY
jgi:hypothetical protein